MNPKIQLIDKTKNFIDFIEIESGVKFCLNREDFEKALNSFKRWMIDNGGTNFYSKLYSLMAQADYQNIRKILMGFPAETIVYLLWYNSESEEKFLEEWDKESEKE